MRTVRLLFRCSSFLTAPTFIRCSSLTYWKLDVWEDDSRRRKRLVPNPYGSSHPEATLRRADHHGASASGGAAREGVGLVPLRMYVQQVSSGDISEGELEKARERLLAASGGEIVPPTQQASAQELVDASDIAAWSSEADNALLVAAGNESTAGTSFSTPAKLLAAGLVVPGTLSTTANELYFDCDENDADFKDVDPKVSQRVCPTATPLGGPFCFS